jgi:hypothetical protein
MKAKYDIISESEETTVKLNLAGGGEEWFLYGQDCYEWKQDGQNDYQKWWKERLVKTIDDILPASDAIAWAAKSSLVGLG